MSKARIFVTGGSGFVGSNTIKKLKKKGYEVFNYDLTEGLDIRNLKLLGEKMKRGDKILHLAAVARFAEADDNPILALETNAVGSMNVALAAKVKKAERIVYSSTGSVYMPIDTEPPIKETDKATGNSVYACMKRAGELYIEMSKVPYVHLRLAHLYGPKKSGHGAIGAFVDRMARGLKPTLFGGQNTNDFTYIDDVVQSICLALETPNVNEAYNVGTGEELSTEHVFKILSNILGYQEEFEYLPPRTVDPLRFVYDMTKASEALGFDAKFSFEEGMKHWIEQEGGKEELIKSIANEE